MINIKSLVKKTVVWKPKLPRHKIIIDNSTYRAPHPIWNMKDAEKVEVTHVSPKTFGDKFAYYNMKFLRMSFDLLSGYRPGRMNEGQYLRRVIFLETIAGVPGMIGGMMRHLRSLRGLHEDGGWIHHLLEEAENERMHLLTFLKIRQPGLMMRILILTSQFIFLGYYSLLYLVNPKLCHRFVGYLEEEAVKTYTNLIKEMDEGKLPYWSEAVAPKIAINYWGLGSGASLRDVMVAIRADEVHHREYNHHFADIPADTPVKGHFYEMISKEGITWEDEVVDQSDIKIGGNPNILHPSILGGKARQVQHKVDGGKIITDDGKIEMKNLH